MAMAALFTHNLDARGLQSSGRGGRADVAQDNGQSRVRTRTMGLRLGPFGLTYIDRALELHPDEVDDLVQEARSDVEVTAKSATFLSQSEIQRVSQNLEASDAPRSTARRRGAAAYAQVASGGDAESGRSLLAVA